MTRSSSGSSLVELLVSAAVMSLIATAFLGVLLINYKTNAKVDNIEDTANAIRSVKERIGKDVREGRSLGDVFGIDFNDGGTNVVWGSDSFPSNRNPVYGASESPPNPWPGAPWPNPPYQLSNRCLIVQIPICDDHADVGTTHVGNPNSLSWPTMIPQGAGNPAAPNNQDNVETHVYQVLPDPVNAGEWIMQMTSFPGYPVGGYNPVAHSWGPETILKGITGPLDSTGNPRVFQFVDKTAANGQPQNSITPTGQFVVNYTGVVVNLEVRRHQDLSVNRRDISITPVGFKMEVFLRNNAIATATGQPSAVGGP